MDYLVAGISTAIAAEDRYRFCIVDHLDKLVEVFVSRAQNRSSWNRNLRRTGSLIGCIGVRDVARKRNDRGTSFQESSENRRIEDGMRLLRIDDPCGIEGRSVEELVRVQFFEGGRVHDAGLDVAGNRDNWSSLLARIHQPIEQMDHAGAGGSAYRYGITA